LATQLERWNDVWEQVFFSYFDSAENIGRRIDGRAKARTRNRNYKVVLFADRDEYVRTLSRRVPGIAGSTGYYDYGMETSFFYASDDPTIEDTWRHELTHQLFQESRRSIAIPFEDQHLWLGEGIAMYFESMVDHGDYAVVGGFDARRLQYARLRRLKEQFRIPLQELAAASRTEFQGLPQLAKVYSLSAGVTHYLMDARYGASREPLIEFLKLCYQGKSNRKSFEDALGESFQQIETEYDKFLRVSAETIDMLDAPERKTELCLIGAELADDSLSAVGRCNNLTWLDLSACDVRGTRLAALESCPKLQQLFLTGAQLDPRAVHVLAQLRIAGLDLSGTDLTDDGLQSLAANAAGLQVLNVAGTKITREGWKSFVQNRPEIQIQSDFGQE